MKKKIIIFFVLISLAIFLAYKYIYAEHRDISSEESYKTLHASELIENFSKDATNSEIEYLDKVVEVEGMLTNWDNNDNFGIINDVIYFQLLANEDLSGSVDKNIKIKGRLIGFDDIMEEIKFDQCTVLE